MCELFASSTAQDASAWEYLAPFAEKSRNSPSGWGIGFFRDGQVLIEKSSESICTGDQVHDGFLRLARVVESRLIISQFCGPMDGQPKESPLLPWSDQFLHHHWLFAFRGDSRSSPPTKAPGPSRRKRSHQVQPGSWNLSGTAWRPRCRSGLTKTFTRPWRLPANG